MTTNLTAVTRFLGYAGLIPFVVPAFLIATVSPYSEMSMAIIQIYAFGIISFLTGSWWGWGLSSGKAGLLLLSNLYFLSALFVFVMADHWWPLASAILFFSIFLAEKTSSLFGDLPQHYQKIRIILTMIASLSMLVTHLAK